MKTYLIIDKTVLDETREDAEKAAIESFGEDAKLLEYPNAVFERDEIKFDEGVLEVSGAINLEGKNLGHINLQVPLDTDMIIEIIKEYTSKMNRLKTVLEIVKKEG